MFDLRDLRNVSAEDLQAELDRRKSPEKLVPEPVKDPDYSELKRTVVDYVGRISTGENRDDDDHYICEAAMKAVYGKDIFTWVNKTIG
jgi:hypothetical protein